MPLGPVGAGSPKFAVRKISLPGVGHDDVGALGQVQIRRAALQAPPDHRQLHPLLDRGRRPVELFDELLRAAELGLPAHRLSALFHVQDDVRVRFTIWIRPQGEPIRSRATVRTSGS